VEIVQTLSRLNRATSGKTRLTGSTSSTNQVVLEGFAKYEAGDCIQDVPNAKVMYDLQAELDRAGIYTDQEIKAYTAVRFKSGAAYAVGEKAQYKDLYAATSILTLRFNDRPAALRKGSPGLRSGLRGRQDPRERSGYEGR